MMKLQRKAIVCGLAGLLSSLTLFVSALAQSSDFYAIVEQNGTVVLCLSKGQILFSDRCSGTGQLTIVQPIKEGLVSWRTAVGTVAVQNESPQNPDCALGRAKWDSKAEQVVATSKRLRKVAAATVLTLLRAQKVDGVEDLTTNDIIAFALDLDNDGDDEIIFVASNVQRVADLNEKTNQPYTYLVRGGFLKKDYSFPAFFYTERGEYLGGTDTIGDIQIKGLVTLASETGEIALLAKTGSGLDGGQELIRYRQGTIQRIQTIEFRCN